MLGRDHQLASCLLTTSGLLVVNPAATHSWVAFASAVVGSGIGALVPDIDHDKSIISQFVRVPFYKLFNHRGVTHGWLAWGVFSAITYWLLMQIGWGFWGQDFYQQVFRGLWMGLVLGYFLHLLEDSWSIDGIRWLSPFSGYDRWTFSHQHRLVRKVVKWRKGPNGKKIPIRHWWGRGYRVGSGEEQTLVGFILILTVIVIGWRLTGHHMF